MATTETVAMEEASHGHLRRELRFWEAIAISIGIMAPTSTSSAPLSKQYVGSGMEDTINFGVTLSAFASCLGCAAGASRILFALGRDGFLTRRLGDASSRTGSPANSLGVVMIFGLVVILLRLNGTTAVNAFFYPGTAGVLAMLIAYFVMQFGAAKFLHLERREPR
jgi:amino acid transporter